MVRYSDYDSFAWIYNKHWGPDSARRFLAVLEKAVLPQLPPQAYVLDLCCGTGQLVHLLLERGYRVTGLDGSEEMIRYARAIAPSGEFMIEDARSFHLPATYHAVVSTYDSLNHVMQLEELSQVSSNVSGCLNEGGLFLFDLNMEEGYKARWRGSFGIVEDDHACVVRASYRPDEMVGYNLITIFRLESGTWHRSDMTLLQRCYSDQEVCSALESAGFADIRRYDSQDLGWARQVGRVFYLCRKPKHASGG
jgi:SAM-dependent methyltransferase